jgi:hypothetical protein
VLTDYGGVYRAGATKEPDWPALVPGTDETGVLGFDISLGGMRTPKLAQSGGTSLRAVSLTVIDLDRDNRADGYLILDTQGGRLHLQPDGRPFKAGTFAGFPANHPFRLLDPDGYAWPFFQGLDIAREMEAVSTQAGVVVLDGWDGIHPVPVDIESNPVFFTNNMQSLANPVPLQTVGLPYVTRGFDDPATTEIDEGDPEEVGPDAASIFTGIEFSTTCGSGLYTLDRFGGVFALGATRKADDNPVPPFSNSPYFFPFLYAEDIALFSAEETGF